MQKPGPTTQPGDLLWLVAQAALPPRSAPWSHRQDQQKVRAPGLPRSMGEAGSGAQCRSWGEAGGAGGRMDVRSRDGRAGRTAGRFSLHSAMASFRRGASVRPPEEPWQVPEGRQGRARPGLRLGTSSQAGAEGAGRGRLGERSPAGLLLPSSGLHTFPGNPAATGPPCESHASLSGTSPFLLGSIPCWDPSLVGIHPLAPNWSSGHEGSSIPQRPPYCPHPRASGSLAQGPAWRG